MKNKIYLKLFFLNFILFGFFSFISFSINSEALFSQQDGNHWKLLANLQFNSILNDGSVVHSGDIAFTLHGNSRSITSIERLVLNVMQRMSGIATKTNAKNRRDWCAKNNAVMVDASLVVETKDKKDARVDNAIRIRISRLSIQNKLGYVRAISNRDYLDNKNPKLNNMVYIYKK